MSKHHCHALHCRNSCPPRHLMCGACWAKVPPEMQREVYLTCKKRDKNAVDHTWAPWWRAAHRAIHHVGVLTFGERWPRAPEWLAKEMAVADQLEGRS